MRKPESIKKAAEKTAWEYVSANFRLDDETVLTVAIDYCKSTQIVDDADKHIAKHGIVVTSSNGSMYANPACGQRNKSTAHRLKCLKALAPYRVEEKERGDGLPV